jgi:hypothetical protein
MLRRRSQSEWILPYQEFGQFGGNYGEPLFGPSCH